MSEPQADGLSLPPRDPDEPFAVSSAPLSDPTHADSTPVSEQEIASLPPLDEPVVAGVPISPSTGQPRRAKAMVAANVLFYLASLVSAGALCWSWWQAIHMATFPGSSTLVERWQPRPGGWRSIVAVTLVFLVGAVTTAAPAIAALNSWNGHRWSRIAALVAVVLGALGWLVHPLALVAPALSLVGAVILWLPPVTRYFGHWERFRGGDEVPLAVDHDVHYGPLPRYA